MRNFLPYLVFLCLTAVAIELQTPEKPAYTGRKDKQDEIAKAWAWEAFLTRDPLLGYVPAERLLTAMEIKNERLELQKMQKTFGAVPGIEWEERGPNNVGGRTRAIMFDLNDQANGYKKVWAGSVSGGLWYTNDITAQPVTWMKVNDLFENLAITAITQNPLNKNEIYFATGEGLGNIDAVRGLGIWKSSNGGATWARLTSTASFDYINDLVVDSNGNLFAAVEDWGIQRSTNGGVSWSKVSGTGTQSGDDIEVASNGDLYASFSSYSGSSIIKSVKATYGANTGAAGNWQNITPNNTAAIVGSSYSSWSRIELATAPSNPNIVYALFGGTVSGSSNCISIQRYDNALGGWSLKASSSSTSQPIPKIVDQGNNSMFTRGQAWYDLIAAVDPNDENTFWIGGVDAIRGEYGGTTWRQMTTWTLNNAPGFTSAQNVHADHHTYVYAPGSSTRMLMGTDGGVYYTEQANKDFWDGRPVFVNKNNGYNVTQFYGGAISPTVANYMLAGAQDNGTQKFTQAGAGNTTEATGGDGGFCHIDKTNHNIQITSYIYNQYRVSTNGGASFVSRNFNTNGGFINPTDYDDTGKKLYAADDEGYFLRWNNPSTGGSDHDIVKVTAFGTAQVTTVTVSPSTANRVYFGLSSGAVVMVDNANTGTFLTGTVIKPASGYNSVSCILVDSTNEDRMLVTYYNYGSSNILYSSNALSGWATWTACDGNLPDMPVRAAIFDPRNSDMVIIGTELGVWSTDDLNGVSTNWQPTNSGLANVKVNQLHYRASDRTLMAVTHGRGVFTAVVPATLPVNWLSFTATAGVQANILDWSVDNELNCKEYVVERRTSTGGFEAIAKVKAKAGNGLKAYRLQDDNYNRWEAKYYYRIKQVDFDGKFTYSKEVLVSRKLESRFVEYVTNTPSTLTVKVNPGYTERSLITVFDVSGRKVFSAALNPGFNQVNITALGKATYLLVAESGKDRYTTKFIK